MRKRYKIGLIVISVLLIIVTVLGMLKMFFKEEKPEKEANVSSIISNISDYGYTLDDRDTKYMKEAFEQLKEILTDKNIDYDEYAKVLAKLFVIDFYTLDNKINKYDVGALEYIYSNKVDTFRQKAIDTIYRDVIDNTYLDRVQELPEITNVDIINVLDVKYNLEDKEVDAIKITMNYEYKENLGYDNEGTIILIKNINKLEVIYYEPKVLEV